MSSLPVAPSLSAASADNNSLGSSSSSSTLSEASSLLLSQGDGSDNSNSIAVMLTRYGSNSGGNVENKKSQVDPECSSLESDISENEQDPGGANSVKSIGMLGSISIAVNSLAGPAVLQLPYQYQRSGIIPTTCCLIFVAVLSSYCSLHMANAVSQVPGNARFQRCIEFSDPFRIFWNRTAYKVTQLLFFVCTVCLNVAAIVDNAQVVDTVIGMRASSYGLCFDGQNDANGGDDDHYFDARENGAIFSLELRSWSHSFGACNRKQSKLHLCTPFADESVYGDYIFTLGYLVTAIAFVPICLMDLKENTNWQIFGFILFMTTTGYFIAFFGQYQLSFRHVSLWGEEWDSMLGLIMFNFGLVLAIPAWLHEKKDAVSVPRVVNVSTIISTVLYIGVGIMGAMAIPRVSANMLSPMVTGAYGKPIQFAASIFAFFIIGLDIPLFSVLARYNLTHSGMCSERTANILVVWIPWLTSWIFYQGDKIGELLSWGGVFFTSAIAFVLPLYLALRILVTTEQTGSIMVYGGKFAKDRKTQILLLYSLLFVAGAAVSVAIAGQFAAERKRGIAADGPETYINTTSSTSTAH